MLCNQWTWQKRTAVYALICRVCFIKTTNLDGESNLKIRRPVDLGITEGQLDDVGIMGVKGLLQCEAPNANLHQFQGRFEVTTGISPSGRYKLLSAVYSKGLSLAASIQGDILPSSMQVEYHDLLQQ